MKKVFTVIALFFAAVVNAQLLTWTPDFIKETSTSVEITMDANYGNKGLLNYAATTDVYVHTGVITSKSTSSSDWKYSKFTWATTDALAKAVYLGNNKWKYTISGGLRTFYGITDPTETIKKISILFRNGAGTTVQRNADASDMYIPVYDNGLYARIDNPFRQPLYNPLPEPINKKFGDLLTITAKSSLPGTLNIYYNGFKIASGSSTTLTTNTNIEVFGDQQIVAESLSGESSAKDTVNFVVAPSNTILPLPAGAVDGINYEQGDTSAILVLYAPLKSQVFVVGDFNNWAASVKYLMNITPDKNRFWIRLTGLTPGVEYGFQYSIDGVLKVADAYSEKVLDPFNDQYIPAATYPNLKPYPNGKASGIVGVLQTAKPNYTWQVNTFARPDKRNLIIYELLVRDFVAAQNWKTLKDTLTYLKRLGINAIELMPFNEFEGNNSWGYNPSFYFAPDKAYGTENALKEFIDECHKQGMAVIMDMVFNHSFYQGPMVQMYWDAANNRPAANSPWFNITAKHPYSIGYDFNHESQATNDLVNRVIQHWIKNYKIDGYRWDLSKGFTQKNSCTTGNCDTGPEVGNWGVKDDSRIAIWNKYYGYMQAASAGSYCILEHFANNDEETILANSGMMLWGNSNYNYNQATQGKGVNTDFSYGIYTARGWSQPNLITYQESHDEERLMYNNLTQGNFSGSYNIKQLPTAVDRNAMATAFWAMQPGPKMMYQFGELGFDFSINRCEDGSIKTDCRTSPKPVRWDYYNDVNRRKLFDVYAALFKLRNESTYLSTFTSGAISYNLAGSIKTQTLQDASLKIFVVGNFDVNPQSATFSFPSTGTWYSYLTDSVKNVTNVVQNVTMQPGEYYIFTNKDLVVLPVKWLSFTAKKSDKNSVLLQWSTAAEINNDHFDIERSNDGINFIKIGSIPANRTAGDIKQYQFNDLKPVKGINYYRLNQVDADGRYNYSVIAKITVDAGGITWQLYPNPAVTNTSLHILADINTLQLLITDMSGKPVFKKDISGLKANQQVSLPVQNLAKGIYMVKVKADSISSNEKLIVQ